MSRYCLCKRKVVVGGEIIERQYRQKYNVKRYYPTEEDIEIIESTFNNFKDESCPFKKTINELQKKNINISYYRLRKELGII